MTQITSTQKVNSIEYRNQKLMQMRSSLTKLPLVTQNHNMVQSKLAQRKESGSKNSETTIRTENSSKEDNSMELLEVFDQKYELQEKIGEGTNGVVYRAVKKRTGETYAVKCFKIEEEQLYEVKANFQVLRSLKHDGVVRYQALYIDMKRHCAWLVMEFLNFHPLSDFKLEDETDIKNVMMQLLQTLSYLHRQNIVHRDVKPENILYNPSTKKIKLIDFGIAKRFRKRSLLTDLLTQTGTLFYRAPQTFLSGGYREGVDVWSAGITLFELLTGKTPFQTQYKKTTIDNISKGQIDFERAKGIKIELKNLIRKMLAKQNSERLSARECLEEPWFRSIAPRSSQELTRSDIMKSSALKTRKRKFSETIKTGEQLPQNTRNYLTELQCYDSEWEEEPLSGITVSNRSK